jgi:hypothetical protein
LLFVKVVSGYKTEGYFEEFTRASWHILFINITLLKALENNLHLFHKTVCVPLLSMFAAYYLNNCNHLAAPPICCKIYADAPPGTSSSITKRRLVLAMLLQDHD